MVSRRSILGPLLTAALACAASLALFWPGYALYDSVVQYRQALSGAYDDWHPPIMARLWAVLHARFGGGAAPMLMVQLALYWLGLALMAGALARLGRIRTAWLVVAIGLCPVFLGWQAAVLKDAQMAGALLAAAGLVAWWRLQSRALPTAATVAVLILIVYATLVRSNAVFASVPFAVLTLAPRLRPVAKAPLVAVAVVLAIAASAPINHRLLNAEPSGVEQTQALFDIAGIGVRADSAQGTGLTPAERSTIIARRCVRPFFWDPLGDDAHCGATMDRLRALPDGQLYAVLAAAMVHHPIAYAGQRLAHLNATDRWLVPRRWPDAAPPMRSEPNTVGLSDPGAAAGMVQSVAGALVETPLGWPFCFTLAAALALVALLRAARAPDRDMALALAASAVALEASFAVVSIASDLRYHLWPMLATALAIAVGWPSLRATAWLRPAAIVLIGGACLAALGARLALPLPPQSYRAMLG